VADIEKRGRLSGGNKIKNVKLQVFHPCND
jgi:hypothetical protein